MNFDVTMNDVEKYKREYIRLGIETGYFKDENVVNYVRDALNNIQIIYDYNLNGAALVNSENGAFVMYINPRMVFSEGEEFISEVFYHEFSHIINFLHRDLFFNNESLLKMYRDNYGDTVRRNFDSNYFNREIENCDEKSPYEYVLMGGALLDEVIAQNITEDMLSCKYQVPRKKHVEYSRFADVSYMTDFKIYGIYQELGESFSRTIRGVNSLRELCEASLKDDFVNNLIVDHAENSYTYEALFKKLSYLGVIYLSQEQFKGHYTGRYHFEPYKVKNIYQSAKSFCDAGVDYRPSPVYTKIRKDNSSFQFN